MTKKFILILCLLSTTFLLGMGSAPEDSIDNNSYSTVTLHVTGMTCSICVQSVEKKLKENKTVQQISVDFDNQIIIVNYNAENPLTDTQIKDAIYWAGYDLISVKRN